MEHGEKLSGMAHLRELQNALIQQRSRTRLSPQSKTQGTAPFGALFSWLVRKLEETRFS